MKFSIKFLLITVAFSSLPNSSYAAGFAANSESASGIANSYAGRATGSHDISDSYINPLFYQI
jgi:long-subunit fatty acid transport protein